MNQNFKFFALRYLMMWHDFDDSFIKGLSKENNSDDRQTCLANIAANYRIARNFPNVTAIGWKPVLDSLDQFSETLTSNEVAVEVVMKLSQVIKETYGRKAISAASKFLWFKYQCPVIIYDNQARVSLIRMSEQLIGEGNYLKFCKVWQEQYNQREWEIGNACGALIQLAAFIPRAPKCIQTVSSQVWFKERVFDMYLWESGRPSPLNPTYPLVQV